MQRDGHSQYSLTLQKKSLTQFVKDHKMASLKMQGR